MIAAAQSFTTEGGMSMRILRRVPSRRRALLVAGATALVGASVAVASTLTAGAVIRVPDNPLGGSPTCAQKVAEQTAAGSVNYPDAEVEPYVAVDPTNPQHLIASFQQDRWNDGGANGLTNVVSTNGGASWSLAAGQPAFTICEGAAAGSAGYLDRATDSISDSFDANGPAFGGTSAILISRSTDGGNHWQTPVAAQVDTSTTVLNDKETVTADPLDANTAYAVWDRLVSPSSHANPSAFTHSPAFRGPALFSKTTDGGVSWSPGRIIFDPGQKNQTIGNQIVIPTTGPAKGTLVNGFDLIFTKGGKGNPSASYNVAVIRSTDGGTTWSDPIIVNGIDLAEVTIAGHDVRTSDVLPEFTANPVNGTLYAVWQDGRFSPTGNSKIAFSQSTDGGLTWSPPIRIDQSPGDIPAFTQQIHVAANGTIGVTYYDLENATVAQPGLTDAFVIHCHATTADCSNPASWAVGGETRLSTSGSFDMTTAPDAGGYFVGDYEGLTASGTVFHPFFVMAQPIATAGRTDAFANTAG
jgi:hypothetical protein